jgi:hypothetical protein
MNEASIRDSWTVELQDSIAMQTPAVNRVDQPTQWTGKITEELVFDSQKRLKFFSQLAFTDRCTSEIKASESLCQLLALSHV